MGKEKRNKICEKELVKVSLDFFRIVIIFFIDEMYFVFCVEDGIRDIDGKDWGLVFVLFCRGINGDRFIGESGIVENWGRAICRIYEIRKKLIRNLFWEVFLYYRKEN